MTLRHLVWLGLAGCSLIKTSTSTSLPGGSSSSTASSSEFSSSSGDSTDDAPDVNGNKVPNLIGLRIEDAKKKMKTYGYEGDIEVIDLTEFDARCKPDTVCGVVPEYWYSGRLATLYKNRSVAITVPE